MGIEYIGEISIGYGECIAIYAHTSSDTLTYRIQHVSDNPSTAPSPRGLMADVLMTNPLRMKAVHDLIATATLSLSERKHHD